MTHQRWPSLLFAVVLLVGCQQQSAEPEPTASAPPAEKPTQTPEAMAQRQVHEFLTALFAGNDEKALDLLTATARQATTDSELALQSPGSPDADFEITEVALLKDDSNQAHVWTVIRDETAEGEADAYDIVWLLRREEARWGVYGMATTLFEDRVPLVLNFEDPEDVAAKRLWAQQEHQRRLQQAMNNSAESTDQR